MTISVDIDRHRKLVRATCSGQVTVDELMDYQTETWLNSNVNGFDGLFDARQGDFGDIDVTSLLSFSNKAATIDQFVHPCKMAIVISDNEQRRLSEFYASAVGFVNNTRTTRIFDSLESACEWLGPGDC
jgi:hypothetical protein